ncbi:hypothetical protein DR950_16685 [Kitasatospora xanthocidica]|uniref:Uncharacterized protein n=1 Tax=Kitasatospora xanthocidica TaxID=83382 RepID=A0A372ZTY1_9ACTN|nr:hypothetical protein [Kitasatospora xanthocidica]RGD59201.1 hypothetical protein DR950_16685 [Kitasatospora xanthocidica]
MRMRIRSVGVALRYAESVLLAPGQQHARRNAWAAVCENRRYAADRRHDDAEAARTTPQPLSTPPVRPAPRTRSTPRK